MNSDRDQLRTKIIYNHIPISENLDGLRKELQSNSFQVLELGGTEHPNLVFTKDLLYEEENNSAR